MLECMKEYDRDDDDVDLIYRWLTVTLAFILLRREDKLDELKQETFSEELRQKLSSILMDGLNMKA